MKYILFILLSLHCLPANSQNSSGPFSFIAIGDMPYFVPDDYPRFERVIKKINQENSAFTIHVGDFKASNMVCTDDYYRKMVRYFDDFDQPLIYTPGDNEWTDCNKKEAGGYDPHERLKVIRSMFFKDGKSLGKKKLTLKSESSDPLYTKYVENKLWEYNGVQFATLHVVGTSNNKVAGDSSRLNEFAERDKANLAWLDFMFKSANETNKIAVVISMQADMFSSSKGVTGFENIIRSITDHSLQFGKPVLLINGDSHKFLMDKPLTKEIDMKINKARVVENFTRLQLFGEQDMHAIKITVNRNVLGIFQIEQLLVEGN